MKWIISLFEIDILKIIHDYNPDKLILNLIPISLEPIHLGHRELRKNQNYCWYFLFQILVRIQMKVSILKQINVFLFHNLIQQPLELRESYVYQMDGIKF